MYFATNCPRRTVHHNRFPITLISYFATSCPWGIIRDKLSATNCPRRIVLRIVRSLLMLRVSLYSSFTPNWKHSSSTNSIQIHPFLTTTQLQTPLAIAFLPACLPDCLHLTLCLSILFLDECLWISWFPLLRFCGRCRYIDFTITIYDFGFNKRIWTNFHFNLHVIHYNYVYVQDMINLQATKLFLW